MQLSEIGGAAAWRGDRPRFTDKQPTNFYYCGHLLEAFPAAHACTVMYRKASRHELCKRHAIATK